MVCRVIDECRCYAYKGETNQFCGTRQGPNVVPCPDDCCFGGCPDDGSRHPFRYIDRPVQPNVLTSLKPVETQFMIVLCIVVLISLFLLDLKISSVR